MKEGSSALLAARPTRTAQLPDGETPRRARPSAARITRPAFTWPRSPSSPARPKRRAGAESRRRGW